jgi:prophage antirepressor-like protein
MNNLKIFTSERFGTVRTIAKDNEPWFVAADVCKALELGNNRQAIARLDDDEKGVISTDTLGGKQEMAIVNEPGLYSLVLGSRKPEAKEFKRWITHEVIPSIRKHGMYATDELIANPDFAIQVFQELKAEREAKKALQAQNAMQAQRIAEMEPKATYYDEVLKCKDALPTSIIAKDYGWSAKRLNAFLHEKGVQYKLQGTWLLYSKYADKGYTKSETYPYEGSYGNTHTAINTKWTQAGRLFIYDLMKKHGNLPQIERD